MTGRFCDMGIFIAPVQGQSPGTGGYDFIRKKEITTFAKPAAIAHEGRLVEPELCRQRLHRFRRGRGAEHHFSGVAGQDVEQHEDHC